MNLENTHKIYFIGIGGIGMSALARYFKNKGVSVSGYDKTATSLTKELEAEGIPVHYEENISLIPKDAELIVYTPAVPQDHKELNFFKENKYEVVKRSEVLGEITKHHFTIAIAGTHGKTSISSMTAHVLKQSGLKITAFIGGISQNFSSNILMDDNPDVLIVEADEYDRSFHTLNPDIAIISSVDADHLDIYGNYENLLESFKIFASKIKAGGKLIRKAEIGKEKLSSQNEFTYSVNSEADYTAINIMQEDGGFVYGIKNSTETIENIHTGTSAFFNIENSIPAAVVAKHFNISNDKIRNAISSFRGVKRRFELIAQNADTIYIDDYAHHPEELKQCILSARKLFPDKKITGVFQPHLYSRTRDLADEFAESLSQLDEVIILDIYPARELPIPGVSPEMILEKMNVKNKCSCKKEDLINLLKSSSIEVLLTLGAGDIDQLVEPIKEWIENKNK
ncbi:MAG: UDP-N-acetylmuramate--L-alanine ligase [Bacteroidota bacterium]